MESKDGYQKHHIIPRQLADHDALKASGMNIHQRSNIIYLPTDGKYHKTRTIHNGPHPGYTANIKRQLDAIDQYGKNNGWKKADYARAINTIISEERKGLRTGRTYLNARSIRGNPCD
ncbi:AHH domain-containing protein [Pseudomonas sp. SWRI124]|nr:AHH domain-containing protein [Pseudomonas khavaziana]